MPEEHFKLSHSRFLPHPFQFDSLITLLFDTMQPELLAAPVKKPQTMKYVTRERKTALEVDGTG
jgi:hypothetical protein